MELPGEEIPKRILKLIEYALEQGWQDLTTLVIRFRKPSSSAQPFYAAFRLTDGKWRFENARVLAPLDHPTKVGSIPIGYPDLKVYMGYPDVIYPEDPNV